MPSERLCSTCPRPEFVTVCRQIPIGLGTRPLPIGATRVHNPRMFGSAFDRSHSAGAQMPRHAGTSTHRYRGPIDVGPALRAHRQQRAAKRTSGASPSPRLLRHTGCALGICITAALAPTTAHADATATVKAKTQRMSDANLSSPQDGWYNPEDKVTLVCSKRGQNVKGYFSFNIPDGWDNLWYKTSDGHFVADVDIETGTLNVVAPECNNQRSDPAPAAAQPGGLRWPLDSVKVGQEFGANPADYQPRGHNGIDLTAPTGTPVYAADDGTVSFEGNGQNNSWMTAMAGICVLLRHNNIHTGYAHLSRTVINSGQHVTKGQLIGYTGTTGMASGPHLHFEVLPLTPDFNNGYSGRVDPRRYLT